VPAAVTAALPPTPAFPGRRSPGHHTTDCANGTLAQ
jgi:hypothetical protein